jgi:hypothetical protein
MTARVNKQANQLTVQGAPELVPVCGAAVLKNKMHYQITQNYHSVKESNKTLLS